MTDLSQLLAQNPGVAWLAGLALALPTILCALRIATSIRALFPARLPPLAEELAKTYATKAELARLEERFSTDLASVRKQIEDTDNKAEDRARGTHSRIDAIYREAQKTQKSIGILIGVLIGKGKADGSLVTQLESP